MPPQTVSSRVSKKTLAALVMDLIKQKLLKKRLLELGESDYMCHAQLSHFLAILSNRKDTCVRSIA